MTFANKMRSAGPKNPERYDTPAWSALCSSRAEVPSEDQVFEVVTCAHALRTRQDSGPRPNPIVSVGRTRRRPPPVCRLRHDARFCRYTIVAHRPCHEPRETLQGSIRVPEICTSVPIQLAAIAACARQARRSRRRTGCGVMSASTKVRPVSIRRATVLKPPRRTWCSSATFTDSVPRPPPPQIRKHGRGRREWPTHTPAGLGQEAAPRCSRSERRRMVS